MEDIPTLLKERKTEVLIDLLSKREELIDYRDPNGTSLLLLSVYFGNKGLMDFILSRKSDLTIFEASACGVLKEVESNLKNNPQLLNSFAPDGFTPLGLASFFSREPVVRFLLQAGANAKQSSNNAFKVAPLHSAAAAKNAIIASMLLEHGAEVNAAQQQGFTPLHSAAHNGDKPMAELLINHGADRNAKTDSGKTPYDLAKEAKMEDLLTLLKI